MEMNYASTGTSELLSTMLIPNPMNMHFHNPQLDIMCIFATLAIPVATGAA
jgi:hypothetical protein